MHQWCGGCFALEGHARSVGRLPNVLDAICVSAHAAGSEVAKGAFGRFHVSLEGGFAPFD